MKNNHKNSFSFASTKNLFFVYKIFYIALHIRNFEQQKTRKIHKSRLTKSDLPLYDFIRIMNKLSIIQDT